MMKISTFIFCISFLLNSFSQNKSISIGGGLNNSNFIFKDSEGNKNKNLEFKKGISINLGYVVNLKNNHIFRTEINYLEAGSKASIGNAFIEWKLNYVGLNFNYLIPFIDKNELSMSFGPSFGYYQLLKANQHIGQNRYDLIEKNSFVKSLNLSSLILHSTYDINKNLSIFIDSRFSYGLNQIENEANADFKNQKTNIVCFSFLAGIKLKTKSSF